MVDVLRRGKLIRAMQECNKDVKYYFMRVRLAVGAHADQLHSLRVVDHLNDHFVESAAVLVAGTRSGADHTHGRRVCWRVMHCDHVDFDLGRQVRDEPSAKGRSENVDNMVGGRQIDFYDVVRVGALEGHNPSSVQSAPLSTFVASNDSKTTTFLPGCAFCGHTDQRRVSLSTRMRTAADDTSMMALLSSRLAARWIILKRAKAGWPSPAH